MRKLKRNDIVCSPRLDGYFGIVKRQMTPPDIFMCIDVVTKHSRFVTDGALTRCAMSFGGPIETT